MTTMAWTFMLIAWTIIIGCTLYSFVKLMSSSNGLSEEPKESPPAD